MTYGIKRFGEWRCPFWRADELKNNREILSRNCEEYADLDDRLFREILRDELDVPYYAITEKNIRKEFGYEKNNIEMNPECLKKIVAYYRWRKALFKKITNLTALAKNTLKKIGSDEMTFRYYVPAEYNNFSCEDPEYTGGQLRAYIEITLRK